MVFCPECGSSKIFKNGLRYTNEGEIQRFLCRVCGYRFSDVRSKNLKTIQANKGSVQVCVFKEAKNLEPQTLEKVCAGDGTLINYAWLLKKTWIS